MSTRRISPGCGGPKPLFEMYNQPSGPMRRPVGRNSPSTTTTRLPLRSKRRTRPAPGAGNPPAPAGPYATALSAFRNTNPNGDWSLFVADDHGVDSGVIAGGWRLNFQTMPGAPTPNLSVARVGGNLLFSWPDTFANYVLETAAALGPGAVWNPVGATVAQGGGFYTVTVPVGAGNGFYRLHGP